MKKRTKVFVSTLFVTVFVLGGVNRANAWKFFGKEEKQGRAVNQLACPNGGYEVTITTYVFGIPVSETTEIRCL